MRRLILAGALVLMMVLPSFVFAGEGTTEVRGEGTITFRGVINAGLYFSVSSLTETSYDLLATEELQPGGLGVDIGQWTLRIDNPPIEETNFTITYSYEPIYNTNDAIEDTIEYVVLERQENTTERTVKTTSDSTQVTISAGSGLNTDTRIFSVRLTETGADAALRAAASDDYIAFITVSLISE